MNFLITYVLGRFFYAPKTYVCKEKTDNNHFGGYIFCVYLPIARTSDHSNSNLLYLLMCMYFDRVMNKYV